MNNTDISSEFILSCLKEIDQTDLIGVIFIIIYIVTLFANITVIVTVVMDEQLQRPMYLCIGVLAVIDMTCSTTVVLKILAVLLFKNPRISHDACFAQLFIMHYMESLEICLLTVMAFDRYVAINYPLRYPSLVTNKVILTLIAILNVIGIILVSCGLLVVASFSFCSTNIIPYCFCDFTALMRIACFKDDQHITFTSTGSALSILLTFLLISFSYTKIILAAFKKNTRTDGRMKVVSTCITHLLIVGLFYFPLLFSYAIPARQEISNSSVNSSLIMIATIIPPLLNPLIYSLRNKEIKQNRESK